MVQMSCRQPRATLYPCPSDPCFPAPCRPLPPHVPGGVDVLSPAAAAPARGYTWRMLIKGDPKCEGYLGEEQSKPLHRYTAAPPRPAAELKGTKRKKT